MKAMTRYFLSGLDEARESTCGALFSQGNAMSQGRHEDYFS
jgi:hypothetical protein